MAEVERSEEQLRPLVYPTFDKEPLQFSIENSESVSNPKVDPANLNAINELINKISSQLLYRWSNVSVILPASIMNYNEEENKYDVDAATLFLLPNVENELEELATDVSTRQRKKLNLAQLESIRKLGQFEVQSKHFPNKSHAWKLASWLQTGYVRSNEAFFASMSYAFHLITQTVRRRLFGQRFSVLSGLKLWRRAPYVLFDKLIGLPHYNSNYSKVNDKIKQKLQSYLVEELRVDSSQKQLYEVACKMLLEMKNDNELKPSKKPRIELPFLFRTPTNLLIDLRLFDDHIQELMTPILDALINTVNADAVLEDSLNKTKINMIEQLRAQNLENSEILTRVNEVLLKEYLEFLFAAVRANPKLESVSPGLGLLLCEHAKSIMIMEQECSGLVAEMKAHLSAYENQLKKKYVIRSLDNEWLNDCLLVEKNKFQVANLFTAHLRSIEKCEAENYHQAAYFIEREMQFLNEQKDPLIRIYNKKKEPTREFTFSRYIWWPSNYIIKNNTLIREVQYHTNTSKPFWRLKNFYYRTWIYLANSLFVFGLVIPFSTTYSYRALFSIAPFYPQRKLINGKIETDHSVASRVLTFASRFSAIWQHVKQSRNYFEQTPDKGLLGKSVSRIFNKIWNYIFVGTVGSILLTLVYPPMCIAISTASVGLALLTPIWYPLVSILQHLFFMFIYDADHTGHYKLVPLFQIFLQFFICGMVCPLTALFTALVYCPVASLLISAKAVIVKLLRSGWDLVMYQVVLKRLARVPSTDTFVARRIGGPGLASNFFYQVRPEQVLAALEMQIELEILTEYLSSIRTRLNEPLQDYKSVFDQIFQKRYSYSFSSYEGPYKQLETETNEIYNQFLERSHQRTHQLYKILADSSHRLQNVRLSEENLNLVLQKGADIVREHYENLILKYANKSSQKMFDDASIRVNDWRAFAGLKLETIFGEGILTPLEESHNFFNLEVNHLNLKKYTKMIADSKLRDDLDLVRTDYKPKSEYLSVELPRRGILMFEHLNDTARFLVSRSQTYELAANLSNPLSLPRNTALVTIITNNHANLNKEDKIIKFESLNLLNKRINENFC